MIKIGITGIMGSGKTTVCRIFQILGVPVYNADIEAKILMTQDKDLKQAIQNTFTEEAFHNDGNINTNYLASIVFNDKESLEALNSLVHPVVQQDFDKWILNHDTAHYVIKEAALIFESALNDSLDKVITVSANKEQVIERLVLRDKLTVSQIEARMGNQLTNKEKVVKADYVISNKGDHLLIPQILKLHNAFNIMD